MLLPVIHRFLHGDFFELSRKSAIGGNLILLFQHSGDGHAVFFANRPCKRRSGVLPSAGIRYVKNVAVAGHVAGHIQQRNAFCASPDIPTHGIRPQLKRRAGGRVRALGVDHELIVKTILVHGGSRLQKRAPVLRIGGDLARGLRGKLVHNRQFWAFHCSSVFIPAQRAGAVCRIHPAPSRPCHHTFCQTWQSCP